MDGRIICRHWDDILFSSFYKTYSIKLTLCLEYIADYISLRDPILFIGTFKRYLKHCIFALCYCGRYSALETVCASAALSTLCLKKTSQL